MRLFGSHRARSMPMYSHGLGYAQVQRMAIAGVLLIDHADDARREQHTRAIRPETHP